MDTQLTISQLEQILFEVGVPQDRAATATAMLHQDGFTTRRSLVEASEQVIITRGLLIGDFYKLPGLRQVLPPPPQLTAFEIAQATLMLQQQQQQQQDTSGYILFSKRIARITKLNTPWEQWGLYASIIGGGIFSAQQILRSYHTIKYIEATDPIIKIEHRDMANISIDQAERAVRMVSKFRMRALAGLSAPLLWMTWRFMHSKKEKYTSYPSYPS